MSLGELIAAVEVGRWDNAAASKWTETQPPGTYTNALGAHMGYLDSALALHQQVLPGWIWGRQVNGAMWVSHRPFTFRAPPMMEPARGLLLCILRALEAEAGR